LAYRAAGFPFVNSRCYTRKNYKRNQLQSSQPKQFDMEFGQLKSAIDLLGFLDLGLTRSESSLGHHLDFSSLCHHRVYAIIWIFADVF